MERVLSNRVIAVRLGRMLDHAHGILGVYVGWGAFLGLVSELVHGSRKSSRRFFTTPERRI
jgi:hypothetical protein